MTGRRSKALTSLNPAATASLVLSEPKKKHPVESFDFQPNRIHPRGVQWKGLMSTSVTNQLQCPPWLPPNNTNFTESASCSTGTAGYCASRSVSDSHSKSIFEGVDVDLKITFIYLLVSIYIYIYNNDNNINNNDNIFYLQFSSILEFSFYM